MSFTTITIFICISTTYKEIYLRSCPISIVCVGIGVARGNSIAVRSTPSKPHILLRKKVIYIFSSVTVSVPGRIIAKRSLKAQPLSGVGGLHFER